MKKSAVLAVALSTVLVGGAVWAAEDEAGGVRLKVRPQSTAPVAPQPMPMPMGPQGQPGAGMPMMGMMQRCMQLHQQVLARLDHLDQKIDHILKEREKESHEQLKEIKEKLEHMGKEIDHILEEREKESHKQLAAIAEKLEHMGKEIDHMFKEGEKEAHERLSAIEEKLEHVLKEQEQETHSR